MIVLYIEFRPFAVVCSDPFAEAVGDVGLVDDGVAFIFFVGEDGLYRGELPNLFSCRAWYLFFFQHLGNAL